MFNLIIALIAGLLFGCGLILSGMTDTAKVIGFLDFFGEWNPALMWVMLGAVSISFVAFQWVAPKKNDSQVGAILTSKSDSPLTPTIDKALIIGSAMFGIGWGLAGYCPGPALASLLSGGMQAIIFVMAMLFGMLGFKIFKKLKR